MQLLLAPAFIFLVGSLFIPLFKGTSRKVYTLLLPVAAFINILLIKPGTVVKFQFLDFTIVPLYADKLSLIVGYIFIIIGFFALLYTLHVKESSHHMLGIWYMGTSLGAVFAGDFLTLYVFWELIAVSSTGLVLLKKDQATRDAAFRYFIMHLAGGLLLLAGIWLNYIDTGSMLITQFKTSNPAFMFFLAGVGVNSGFVLLHTWLPDTYPRAPFTASVFMSVYTTKTAVYLLARTTPSWEFVAYMGATMAVFGVTMALMQNNARKLLSYHIISQVGYMVAAIGIGTSVGIDGGIFHLFNHILYKALLFMTIGSVIYATGKEKLSELGGLAKKMPVTTTAVIVASLSISGTPFFNGFASKLFIFEAAHSNDVLYLMLELAAIGTLLSFLKFTYYGFLRPNKELEATAKEVPIHMQLAMGGVALLCFLVGVFPNTVTALLPFGSTTAFFTGKNFAGVSQLIVVSVVAFTLGRHKIFVPHNRLTFDFDSLYIKVIESLAVFPRIFSQLNDLLEKSLEKIPSLLATIKKPVIIVTDYISDLFFAIWVDFWLFEPISKTPEQEPESEQVRLPVISAIFAPFGWLVSGLVNVGKNIAKLAEFLENQVVNKTAEQVSTLLFTQEAGKVMEKIEDKVVVGITDDIAEAVYGNNISKAASLFDKLIVDGVVNGIAGIIFFVGEKVRRAQTGLVQNYALIIIVVVSVLLFLLSVRGA